MKGMWPKFKTEKLIYPAEANIDRCEPFFFGKIIHLLNPESKNMLVRGLYGNDDSKLDSGPSFTCRRKLHYISETDKHIEIKFQWQVNLGPESNMQSESFSFVCFQFVLSGLSGFLATESQFRPTVHAVSRHGTLNLTPLPKDDEVSCEVRPQWSPIRNLTSLDQA